jgi:hypothetical protein
MPLEPFGYTIFCDDIRNEIGNKFTLVGAYRDTMLVRAPAFPVNLPKLGLHIVYIEHPSIEPTDMVLRVFLPGDSDNEPTYTARLNKPADLAAVPDALPHMRRVLNFQFVVSPLVLKGQGDIKVRVLKEDRVVRLGRLAVSLEKPPSTKRVPRKKKSKQQP